jgi:hypothetical protein
MPRHRRDVSCPAPLRISRIRFRRYIFNSGGRHWLPWCDIPRQTQRARSEHACRECGEAASLIPSNYQEAHHLLSVPLSGGAHFVIPARPAGSARGTQGPCPHSSVWRAYTAILAILWASRRARPGIARRHSASSPSGRPARRWPATTRSSTSGAVERANNVRNPTMVNPGMTTSSRASSARAASSRPR